MALAEAVPDLEVLEAAPARIRMRSAHRRRWPTIVAAVAVIAFVVAFPVRVSLAKAEFIRLQARWQQALVLTDSYAAAAAIVDRRATEEDAPLAASITRTLNAEHARALRRLRTEVQAEWTPDPSIRHLRQAIGRAMTDELGRLDAVGQRLDAPASDRAPQSLDALLAKAAHRFHLRAAAPRSAPTPADPAALAPLSRFLDVPTADRVVAVNRGTFTTADIDASRITTAAFESLSRRLPFAPPVQLAVRDRYLAVISGDGVFAMPLSLDGDPRLLGRADIFFPALRPDAVWLVNATAGAAETTTTEITGDGTVLAGPYHGTDLPIADLGDGRFLADAGHATFSIWQPGAGTPAPSPLPFAGAALASSANVVAVEQLNTEPPQMHVISFDARGGVANTAIADPAGMRPADLCQFSPSGATLACVYEPDNDPGRTLSLRLGLIDVASGRLTLAGGVAGIAPGLGLGWSPDGNRVFVSSVAGHPLAVFHLGDDRVHQLRLTGTTIQQFVVLPDGT